MIKIINNKNERTNNLFTEEELLIYNIGKVSKLVGMPEPIWIFEIKNQRPENESTFKSHNLEFKNSELLDHKAFSKKYFRISNRLIHFTKKGWTFFFNVLSEKAEVLDVKDFPEYVDAALLICIGLHELKVDTESEHPYFMIDNNDGYYYLHPSAVKSFIKHFNLNIRIKIVKVVLEKLGVKMKENSYIEIDGLTEKIWTLSAEKLDYYKEERWDLLKILET
jgi:hypothetical protein